VRERKKENKTEYCNWRFLVSVSLCFLSVFYILTCIISFSRETEKGIEHTWFWEDEDDGGAVFSASPGPLLPFGLLLPLLPLLSLMLAHYFSTLSLFLRSHKLSHSLFFFFTVASPLSPFFVCLALPLAFIARGRQQFW